MEIKEGHTTGSGTVEPFQIVAVDPNGKRKSFSHGGNMYYQSEEDEELYFLSTGGTRNENYIRLGAAEAAPAPESGGGGGGGSPEPAPQSGSVIYPDGQGPVMDSGPTGGYANWQEPMFNYQPITHGQHLNPLVDPNNWAHTPEQQMGLLNNPGLYVSNPRPFTGVLS
jgi:hypothetical protein